MMVIRLSVSKLQILTATTAYKNIIFHVVLLLWMIITGFRSYLEKQPCRFVAWADQGTTPLLMTAT